MKYHFNARWYDAETARFVSEDPARDGGNWFTYVANNPLRFIDPTGLLQEFAAGSGGGISGTARIQLSGKDIPDQGSRDNTYDYTDVLLALGATEQEIADNRLMLGESDEWSWDAAGCRAWSATITLMLMMQENSTPVSLDIAIEYVQQQIDNWGLLSQDGIINAGERLLLDFGGYTREDFISGRISFSANTFEDDQLTGETLRITLESTHVSSASSKSFVFGIGRSALDDIKVPTHFIILRSLFENNMGFEFGYWGTSKNDDQHESYGDRRYVLYDTPLWDRIYRINRVEIFTLQINKVLFNGQGEPAGM
jgi:hypothetical protein